ncbi:MAG: MYG1 family protein [Candidatus Pacebacteria bacterium]|nr:MYG1 family protein [Candidatus Paceibacterota bacterium]
MKKIITHNGSFHADEIFACAILSILNNNKVEIIRSRDPEVWEMGDYVVDVGGVHNEKKNRFDHHQVGGGGKRENGIPYSSMGLVWKLYGKKVSGSAEVAKLVDEKLVQPIDAVDSGVSLFSLINPEVFPYSINNVLGALRPTWKEEAGDKESIDEGFAVALNLAKDILLREIKIARDQIEANKFVLKAYNKAKDKRVIVIEGHYPCDEILLKFSEPLFVVKPDHQDETKWKVKTVRKGSDSFEARKFLPVKWSGKKGEEFAKITGVKDSIFCHVNCFVAVAGSKAGALKLAELALNN